MRLRIVLLTLFLTTFSLVGVAQSNKAQQLKRYIPRMQNSQQDFGQDKLEVYSEKGIPIKTKQALVSHIRQHYKIAQIGLDVYKLQDANELYFVIVSVNKDNQDQVQTLLLVLREQGGVVSEVSKAEEDTDAGVKAPAFFLGQDKTLIIVSYAAPDGSLFGHVAYEYASNNLKPLGSIPVIDKLGMSGSVWITNNEIGAATARYKNNTYDVTIRGKGTLYESRGYSNNKRIASPGVPVTFSYLKGEWRLVAGR